MREGFRKNQTQQARDDSVLLSRSGADIRAAGATVVATRGASSKIGTVLDDVVARYAGWRVTMDSESGSGTLVAMKEVA